MNAKFLTILLAVGVAIPAMARIQFLAGQKLLSVAPCQYAAPNWHDIDGDGEKELLVGLKRPILNDQNQATHYEGRMLVLRNEGTVDKPSFSFNGFDESTEFLTSNGEPIVHVLDSTVDNYTGCWGMQATFGDINGDGNEDLVFGGLYGSVTVYLGTGTPGQYEEPQFFNEENSPLTKTKRSHASLWDRDGDGKDELIIGYMHSVCDAMMGIDEGAAVSNMSSFAVFAYADGALTALGTLKDASGKVLNVPNMVYETFPQAAYTSRSGPSYADIDGDGLDDLVTGSTAGGVFYFPAEATNALGKASSWSSKAVRLIADGTLGQIGEGNPPRARVAAADMTGDGVVDLLVGYANGMVYLYRGTKSKGFQLPWTQYTNLVAGVALPSAVGTIVNVSGAYKVTASGLPSGLKLKKNKSGKYYISGTPSKVQSTTATFTVKNKKGKKLATTKVKFAVRAPKVAILTEPFYVIQPGVATNLPVTVEAECTYTMKASNLPTGLKLVKNASTGHYSLKGTPTATGEKTVTLKATYVTNTKTGVTAQPRILTDNWRSDEIPLEDHYDVFIAGVPVADFALEGAVGCTASVPKTLGLTFNPVTGGFTGTPKAPGKYLITFTRKVRTSAPAAKPVFKTYKATTLFVVYQGLGDHSGDAGVISPALTVNFPAELEPAATNVCSVGVWFSMPFGIDGGLDGVASDLAASGLPKGLACKNGAISGVPSKAGLYKVTVTASNKYGWTSEKNVFWLKVNALPTWARGTFNGGVTNDVFSGTFTFTVATTGKISGKILSGGKTYKFSDAGYADCDEGGYLFEKTLTVAGLTLPVSFFVEPSVYVTEEIQPDAKERTIGRVTGDPLGSWLIFDGEQSIWSRSDVKKFVLPTFASGVTKSQKVVRGTLKFKFGNKGAVTVSGKIDGKKVSGSAMLLMDSLDYAQCGCYLYGYNCRMFISLPKANYFSVAEVTIDPGSGKEKRTAENVNIDCDDKCL